MAHAPSPTLTLNNGLQMPQLGLGTYTLNGRAGTDAVIAAADIGYRLFDTAFRYGNEAAVGAGVNAAERASRRAVRHDQVRRRVPRRRAGTWRPRRFTAAHGPRLRRLAADPLAAAEARPLRRHLEDVRAVARCWQDQVDRRVELQARAPRPTAQRHRHRAGCQPDRARPHTRRESKLARTTKRTASSRKPGAHSAALARPHFRNPTIVEIARAHDRTPAQIALRWCIEIGVSTVPKSGNIERMAENIEIFDFALTADDMARIATLDQGESAAQNSDRIGH